MRPLDPFADECLSGRSMNHPLSTSFNDAADLIEKYGWLQDEFGDKTTGLCEEGAVLAVECTPGDQHLARQVLITLGGGAVYNDAPGRTKAEVIKHLRSIGSITDDDLEQTFGPNWKPIRNFVRQAAKMTPEQAKELKDRGDVHDAAVDADRFAAWHAVRSARWHAVRSAAWEAVRYAVRDATRPVVYDAAVDAVRSAAWDAVRSEVRDAVRYAVRDAVRYAAAALVVIDIAPDAAGILLGPWSAVMGDPRDVAV